MYVYVREYVRYRNIDEMDYLERKGREKIQEALFHGDFTRMHSNE